MPDQPKIKHLTVIGFAGQKNSSDYVNAGKVKHETRNPKLPRKISELCNILMAQCKNSDTKTYHLCIKTNNTKPMPFRQNSFKHIS